MKLGIADYGMNVWEGACYDYEERWLSLKGIGYEGMERLHAVSADDALCRAARMRRVGMGFATCLGPTPELSIQWTAALGKPYVWAQGSGPDFDIFCRQANIQTAACGRWGIRAALHNHLGSPVESQEELEAFLERCPECALILDTAHLAAAGGDPAEIVRRHPDRLASVHLKDWLVTDASVGLENWPRRGRFCELGAGNIGLDNAAVMRELTRIGYDGWVFVEHDTHLRDPLTDLAISREYLRRAGH
ncbi:MAG: TIM barrel protein [Armatimonadetes bacterium]|nr:TIM barrel protein [Armatimonadota bacterium]